MASNYQQITFAVGDLVWAKLKNRLPWPAKIVHPHSQELLKLKPTSPATIFHLVQLFGTQDLAWIGSGSIKPYQQYKTKITKISTEERFLKACKQIEDEATKEKTETGSQEGNTKTCQTSSIMDDKIISPRVLEISTGKHSSTVSTNRSLIPPKRRKIVKATDPPHLIKTTASDQKEPMASTSKYKPTAQDKDDNAETPIVCGFLGAGRIGSLMIGNLLTAGHSVVIWNRTLDKCKKLEQMGAKIADSPQDVVSKADITFACVADKDAVNDILYGRSGVVAGIKKERGKGFVNMTSVDVEASNTFYKYIKAINGQYLEAQLIGTVNDAVTGNMMIFCAGDHSLYKNCMEIFGKIGRKNYYLEGESHNAVKMRLVHQVMKASIVTGLAEALALAKVSGLDMELTNKVIKNSSLLSPLVQENIGSICTNNHECQESVDHLKRDVKMAVGFAHDKDFPMTVTSNALESLKHASRLGLGYLDCSSVFRRSQF